VRHALTGRNGDKEQGGIYDEESTHSATLKTDLSLGERVLSVPPLQFGFDFWNRGKERKTDLQWWNTNRFIHGGKNNVFKVAFAWGVLSSLQVSP
jgi:hypothetical protein